MGDDEPIDPRCVSRPRCRRRRMISQVRTTPATMARKPRTTITAIAQCGKADASLDCWMVPDGEDDEEGDEADAVDATDAVDSAECVDCTERVEREDCDMEEATESAHVVSEQLSGGEEFGILTRHTQCKESRVRCLRAVESLRASYDKIIRVRYVSRGRLPV